MPGPVKARNKKLKNNLWRRPVARAPTRAGKPVERIQVAELALALRKIQKEKATRLNERKRDLLISLIQPRYGRLAKIVFSDYQIKKEEESGDAFFKGLMPLGQSARVKRAAVIFSMLEQLIKEVKIVHGEIVAKTGTIDALHDADLSEIRHQLVNTTQSSHSRIRLFALAFSEWCQKNDCLPKMGEK